MTGTKVHRFGFIMEQTLGHITHHKNLERRISQRADIEPHWLPIAVSEPDVWQNTPIVKGNWSLKASLRARGSLTDLSRAHRMDALFFHTQTTALFSVKFMRRIPSIVSLDATPLNYDTVAPGYGDSAGNGGWLERRKYEWNRATFREAAHLITWCDWARKSLICDYGIAEDRISVIPPGVDLGVWGGLAADTLTGGAGNDTFAYRTSAESTATVRDSITDFTSGDKIDLHLIDANTSTPTDDPFVFIGTTPFTHTPGELRYEQAIGNSWLVQGDTNGDGSVDFAVLVTIADGHTINAGDFIL